MLRKHISPLAREVSELGYTY